MRIATRIHDLYDGAAVSEISRLDIGSVSPGASRIVVISAYFSDVESVSSLSFHLSPSPYLDLNKGIVRWWTSKTFEIVGELPYVLSSDDRAFDVPMLDGFTSSYVYLQFDTFLGITSPGTFDFEWETLYADLIHESSSSSNEFVRCTDVPERKSVSVQLPVGETACFSLDMESNRYGTLFLNDIPFEVGNVAGVPWVNGKESPLSQFTIFLVSGVYYVFTCDYTNGDDNVSFHVTNYGDKDSFTAQFVFSDAGIIMSLGGEAARSLGVNEELIITYGE